MNILNSSDYNVTSEIMIGGFGTVFAATRVSDNKSVAIKKISVIRIEKMEKENGQDVLKEIILMRKVENVPGVIKIIDWVREENYFFIIMERLENFMDLEVFMTETIVEKIKLHLEGSNRKFEQLSEKELDVLFNQFPSPFDESQARFIFRQIHKTVIDCKSAGVYHGDIKIENILVNVSTLEVKLFDFGCGDFYHDEPRRVFDATFACAPPEIQMKKIYHAGPTTVWMLGFLLYQLICDAVPFKTSDDICINCLKWRIEPSSECKNFVSQCLAKKARKRIFLEEMINHPWMTM